MRSSKFASALEHFKSLLVKREDGCWYLSTKPQSHGYSQFSHTGKCYRGHVFSYDNLVAEIPDGYEVHHKCEVKQCVNPEHLELLTNAEHLDKHPNNQAAKNKAKTHCIRGHEYTEANTYHEKNGRQCRACRKIANTSRDAFRSLLNASKKTLTKLDK